MQVGEIEFFGSAGIKTDRLTLLVFVELQSSRPMLNLRLLQNRLFRVTNLVSVCVSVAFFGIIFIVPLMVQTVRGRSALVSGGIVGWVNSP